MATSDVADLLVPFCEAASISLTRDTAAILKKRVIVSLCFANTRMLHDSLFPDQHMDWNGVKEYSTHAETIACKDWLALLGLMDFVNEQPNRQMVTDIIASTLAGIKVSTQGKSLSPLESLQLCFAKAGIAPSWDVLCKTLILCNLAEIDHAVAIQLLLQQQPPATVDTIIKALPSCKHTPDEYTQIFMYLLSGQCCHVRTHVLSQAFQNRAQKKEKIKKHAQSIYHAHKKPSLTHILEIKTRQQLNNNDAEEGDSFAHFCNVSRLTSNASLLVKRAMYYLFVTGVDYNQSRFVSGGAGPAMMIAINPDMQALKAFITEMHHTGSPCTALRLFKDRCIPGNMHWSAVLRLYLAAYCKPVAKELWRFAVTDAGGGLCSSSETEITTQRFVAAQPLDADAIIDLVLAEEPSPTTMNG